MGALSPERPQLREGACCPLRPDHTRLLCVPGAGRPPSANGEVEALRGAAPSWTGTERIWEEGSESKLMFFHFTIWGAPFHTFSGAVFKDRAPSLHPSPSLCFRVKPGFTQ